jgi:hypothetical protein
MYDIISQLCWTLYIVLGIFNIYDVSGVSSLTPLHVIAIVFAE